MAAVNELVGDGVAYVGDESRVQPLGVAPDNAPSRNIIPDGTEWTTALIVLGALAFLALLEVGGFKTVLAASVSTGR